MAQTGNTATIAFTTSSWTGDVEIMEGLEQTREALECTDLADTSRTYIADAITDRAPMRVQIYWDQSASTFPPLTGAAETITISYPLKTGEGTNATLAGTGILTRVKGPDLESGTVMRGEFDIQFTSEPTYTAGSA